MDSNIEQALALIDSALSSIQTTREVHVKLQEALDLVKKSCKTTR